MSAQQAYSRAIKTSDCSNSVEQEEHGNMAVSGWGLRWPPSLLPFSKLDPIFFALTA
jgi:hypothetical protein